MTIPAIDLDHVAIAVEEWADAWPRLVGVAGGRWMSGGKGPGFSPCQLGFANGMRVEVLQPHLVEVNDFLRRFLDRSGPGPHHFTFKVKDLAGALAEAEAAGYPPINVDMSDPHWKEAFLHPKGSCGVVVQLAQPIEGYWETPAPEGFPARTERSAPMASVVHVVHAVANLDDGLRLFSDLLGGARTGEGADESARWIDLAWPGPGRIRLAAPSSDGSPLAEWLGGRAGRVHHIALSGVDLSGVGDGVELADGSRELPPDSATGTRLLLHP
jgi:methylmalonyl-CoA/ethylmalonyl-CoA epimerase